MLLVEGGCVQKEPGLSLLDHMSSTVLMPKGKCTIQVEVAIFTSSNFTGPRKIGLYWFKARELPRSHHSSVLQHEFGEVRLH